MEKFVVKGGNKLSGEVTVSGAKNAAVAILPACILIKGKCRIENLPEINDVKLFIKILERLNADVNYISKDVVEIDCTGITSFSPPHELTRKMRGSTYLIGALLGRFHKVEVSSPGGCDFGTRPIDQHIKGLASLNAKLELAYDTIHGHTDKLTGGHIYFDVVTVGATINVILGAVLANGTTTIENAAKEPHIVDLANFLNAMGAKIRGAGTDTIKITGVEQLHGGTYSIIPDQIEAGTFMIAAAATRGDVILKNIIPKHLEPISAKLIESGVCVEEFDDSIRVYVKEGTAFKNINFIALPYPGYPTDMQPQLVTFLTTVSGISIAREGVWDERFRYVGELKRMGADIRVEGKTAIISGVGHLRGTSVRATDLRAGAAMLIAGLTAQGTTEITDIYHIDRGYENIEKKLLGIGADIHRVSVVEDSLE
ncbi:MAG: UDP-N-acetylglucosamine 1-carboxyvinyltransferase [Oscillospiraceae bacterium]|nr:UDP-N-acetylglucosamine 1-carboxyvinyltransferase [Oscillospiraceae bacterium]